MRTRLGDMPRRSRCDTGGVVFHVLNRANGGATLFEGDGDYEAFVGVLAEANERVGMRTLAYCVMPNHWHMVLWPRRDGDLSEFVHWLTVTHVRRWHTYHGTAGAGHLYQGRYKSFPVQTDAYFQTVCRYVERNPLRANLVEKAEDWRWSSLWQRENGDEDGPTLLDQWPVPRPDNWPDLVNQPQTEQELVSLRVCACRGRPYGSDSWVRSSARRLGLQSTLRPRGRPPQTPPQ